MYIENRTLLEHSAACAEKAVKSLQTALESAAEAQAAWQQAVNDQNPDTKQKFAIDTSFAETIAGAKTGTTAAAAVIMYYAKTRFTMNDEPEPQTAPHYAPVQTRDRPKNIFDKLKDKLVKPPEEPTGHPKLNADYKPLDIPAQQQRIEAWKRGEPITSAHQPIAQVTLTTHDRELLEEYMRQNPGALSISYNKGSLTHSTYSGDMSRMGAEVRTILRVGAQAMQSNVQYDVGRSGEQFDQGASGVDIRMGMYTRQPDATYAHTDAMGFQDLHDVRYAMTLVGPPTEFITGELSASQFGDGGAMHPTGRPLTWTQYGQQNVRFDALSGHRAPTVAVPVPRLFMTITHRIGGYLRR